MTRAPFDVVGFGANSVDTIYRLPAYPEPHGPHAKMRISGRIVSCGGQIATALCTVAAMGLRATYVAVTGDDENGRLLTAELTRRGVDLTHALTRPGITQFAIVLLPEGEGERIILWDRDERLRLDPAALPRDVIVSARAVIVDDVDQEGAIAAASLAREAGRIVVSDVDRLTDRTAALIDAVTVPVVAEHIPAGLTGEEDLVRALRRLRRPHHQALIATLGARGAAVLSHDEFDIVPGFRVDAVDTTGAGDVFRGALVVALLEDRPVADAVRLANAAAAVSCTRLGAIGGVPTRGEVDALLERAG